jgi:hypothetical protein
MQASDLLFFFLGATVLIHDGTVIFYLPFYVCSNNQCPVNEHNGDIEVDSNEESLIEP